MTKSPQDTWNLSPLFSGDANPRILKNLDHARMESYRFINKWKSRTDYLEIPKVLKEALDEYESWAKHYGTNGDAGYYINLRLHQEQNNPKLRALANKIKDKSVIITNDIQFFTHNIAKIPQKDQSKFLKSAYLKDYKHFLESLFKEAKYLLTDAEEKILNLTDTTAHTNWIKMTSNFLAKEERHVLDENANKTETKKNLAEILSLLSSKDKIVRDTAAKAINEIFEKYVDTAENELNSILDYKKTIDDLRKLPRPDTARHLNDDMDTKVIDTLVNAVSEKFDVTQSYYELKAKLLGVKKLEYHERNVEYGTLSTQYKFAESTNLVSKTLQKLDPEFYQIFQDLLSSARFDVFPKKDKTSGAFCTHGSKIQPTYILLNHTNKLPDVLTLAHETGHAIHNELIRQKQNELNFGTSLAIAETASTFMEDFVLQEVAQQTNEEEKLALIMTKLNDDVSTIQRQIACYKFEQELHKTFREVGYLSKEDIGKMFTKHMRAYMGNYVIQSPGSQNWWIYWSHIRSFFYVYSYASGLLISKSLQNMVKQNPEFIKEVKKFLSTGDAKSPKNALLTLGVDITDKKFWAKGLAEQKKLLSEAWTLAEKLGKI